MTEAPAQPGFLLGGRLRHDQFASGHRTGLEPVLLAAMVPARPGERVLEAGSGSGAGLLCLAARVAGIAGVGVEIDPGLAALATANAAANGFAGLRFAAAAIEAFADAQRFDHAFANPPWRPVDGSASPDAARDLARRSRAGLISVWVRALARQLRHRGTLTLAVGVAAVPDYLAGLVESPLGGAVLVPLWPRAGQPAKLALLQATRGSRAALRISAGLVLHMADGRFTPAANAILRDGQALVP